MTAVPRRCGVLIAALWLAVGCADEPVATADASGSAHADSGGLDTGIGDTGADDTGPDTVASDIVLWDAGAQDTGTDCPGGPGCPCTGNGSCDAGLCIQTVQGDVCARKCTEDCPAGFKCHALGGDKGHFCIPRHGRRCEPCTASEQCEATGQEQPRCLRYGEDGASGSFCGSQCGQDADCGPDFVCAERVTTEGDKATQCVLKDPAAVCPCSKRAASLQLKTTCSHSFQNPDGPGSVGCPGTRKCTVAGPGGLGPCVAPGPSAETCNELDDDCDGTTDEKTCDDENICTADQCAPAKSEAGPDGCVHIALDGGLCGDGDPCTAKDKCVGGKCKGTPSKQLCDCFTNADCTDKNGGDLCKGTWICDDSDNTCKHEHNAVKCEQPKDPCTKSVCVAKAGKCVTEPAKDGTTCDDGDLCSIGDACDGGKCVAPAQCKCDKAADCAGQEDGNPCTGTLYCSKSGPPAQWACKSNPSTVVKCVKGLDSACRKNLCDAKTGQCAVVNVKVGTACDDGTACTANDACALGVSGAAAGVARCVGGVSTCACTQTADCTKFEDGKACNGTMYCHKATGKCRVNPATLVVCQTVADTGCLKHLCDDKTGKCGGVALPDGTTCTDANKCTVGETCDKGVCTATAKANICACAADADCAKQEDGDICNGTLYCDKQAGKCVLNKVTTIVCPTVDDTACARNTCDKKTGKCGLKAVNPGLLCDDDNACTTGDTCKGPACVGKVVCSCAADKDCAAKEDGDACNGTLFCNKATGKCALDPKTVVKCAPSGSSCFNNVCKPATGKCVAEPIKFGKPCDDGNSCSADSCVLGKGCVNTPVKDGVACALAAKEAGICKAGACAKKPAGVDLDHDGLVGAADPCPTVWNPDADKTRGASSCPAFTGTGWTRSSAVKLGDGGSVAQTSKVRRTSEPVELPLINGILDDSVVGYWKLDGGVKDASGQGAHGKLNAISTREGAFGDGAGALGFAGDCATLPHRAAHATSTGTVMLWFKPSKAVTAATATQELIAKEKVSGIGAGDFEVRLDKGRVLFEFDGLPSVSVTRKTWEPTWTHVAVTFGGEALRLFVDGRLVASRTGEVVPALNDTAWTIGCVALGGKVEHKFAGALDDIVVLDRALAPDEVATYVGSKAPYGSSYVPGAQADFDDLRISESTEVQAAPHLTHTEVVGVRPRSDTDLDGVLAYWKLGDGAAVDVVSGKKGLRFSGGTIGAAGGRFGDAAGALKVDGNTAVDSRTTIKLSGTKGFAIEAWVWLDTLPKSAAAIMGTRPSAHLGGQISFSVRQAGNLALVGVTKSGGYTHVGNPAVKAGRWHHVAVSWSAAGVITFYVDGRATGTSKSDKQDVIAPPIPPFIGASRTHTGTMEFPLKGRIDELVIHKKPRPVDYFARRARGLPRLRLLAHTREKAEKSGLFKLHDYRVWWGNAKADAAPTRVVGLDGKLVCDGLLSPCLGYAGWWRMQGGDVGVLRDATSHRRDVPLAAGKPEMLITPAPHGTARSSTGGRAYAKTAFGIAGAAMTLEAVGRQDHLNVASLIRLGKLEIGVAHGIAMSRFILTKPVQAVISSSADWRHIAGVFTAKGVTSMLGGGATKSAACSGVCPAVAATDQLRIGHASAAANRIDIAWARIMSRPLTVDELLHQPPLRHGLMASVPKVEPTCPLGARESEIKGLDHVRHAVWLDDGTALAIGPRGAKNAITRLKADDSELFSVTAPAGAALPSHHVAGSMVAFGTTSSTDTTLTRVSVDGTLMLSTAIKSTGRAHAFATNASGAHLVVGRAGSASSPDVKLTCAEAGGTARWQHTLSAFGKGVAFDTVARSRDFVVCGAAAKAVTWSGSNNGSSFKSVGSDTRPWMLQVGDAGHVRWARRYEAIDRGVFMRMAAHPAIGWIAAGHAVGSTPQTGKHLVAAVDGQGALRWARVHTPGITRALAVHGDGRILLAGRTFASEAAELLLLNTDGTLRWRRGFEPKGTDASLLTVGFIASGVAAMGYTTKTAAGAGPDDRIHVRLDPWGEHTCAKSGLCAAAKNACDDADPCTIDSCDAKAGCKHSPIADCKGAKDLDLDHDRLAGKADACPTAWTPANAGQVCAAFAGKGWKSSAPIELAAPGYNTGWAGRRRTNEPVEVPLASGLPDSSVLGYWKLDGGGADESEYGRPAIWLAGVGKVSDAVAGAGVALRPLAGDKGLKVASAVPISAEFSMMAWVRTTEKAPFVAATVAATTDSKKGRIALRWMADGAGKPPVVQAEACGARLTTGKVALDLHKRGWTHLAMTTSAAGLAIYVDGTMRGFFPPGGSKDPSTCTALTATYIGAAENAGYRWNGDLDEVLMFDRALHPDEVWAHADSQAPYGSSLVAGSQPDFDDVRVTERTTLQPGEHATHAQLLGVRRHSDTDLAGVVAYWRLDGDGMDRLGLHHGKVSGAPTKVHGRFGDVAGAFRFGGAKQVVTVAHHAAFATAQGTWEAWIRPEDCSASQRRFLTKNATGRNDDLSMGIQKGCGLFVEHQPKGGSSDTVIVAQGLAKHRWSHVAVTWNGKRLRAYVDGILRGDKAMTRPVSGHNAPVLIGKPGTGQPIAGRVDEVLIHNVARSSDYIAGRARGLPRVRWLAHTRVHPNAGAYRLHGYRLWWGNPAAKRAAVALKSLDKKMTCGALLSPCLGYVGYWRLDRWGGGVSVDRSSWRHLTEAKGGAIPGVAGGAAGVVLDGVKQYLRGVDADGAGIGLKAYTLEAVARILDGNRDQGVIGYANAPFTLFLGPSKDKGGDFRVAHRTGANTYASVDAVGAFKTAEWVHAAGRFDGARQRLLVGGKSEVSKPTKAGVVNWSGGFRIGHAAYNDGNNRYLKGAVQHVRVMNRAVADDELLIGAPLRARVGLVKAP